MDKGKALNYLTKCFSESEWEWLLTKDEFRAALERVATMEDAETAVQIGVRLLPAGLLGWFLSDNY